MELCRRPPVHPYITVKQWSTPLHGCSAGLRNLWTPSAQRLRRYAAFHSRPPLHTALGWPSTSVLLSGLDICQELPRLEDAMCRASNRLCW